MSVPVLIQPRAKQDLLAAAAWWAEHRSPEQAARWYDGFLAAIESLSENPARHPLARENGKFPYELRELHYGLGRRPTHRAVFTIRSEAVVVLTVRHTAQRGLANPPRMANGPRVPFLPGRARL